MKNENNIAIIGAGASGMMAAIVCARNGASVTIFEKNEKAGKKIYASGNGRCNVTNVDVQPSYFHSTTPQVIEKVLHQFSKDKTVEFFRDLGIELVENEDGRMYPLSRQASIMVEQMLYAIESLGVKLYLGIEITKISKENGKFSLFVSGEKKLYDKVIISAGGEVASHLGGSDSGYNLAKMLGHSIVKTMPSLVQLDCKHPCLRELKGVRVDAEVNLVIDKKIVNRENEDLLFTEYGLSGPTILKSSRLAALALDNSRKVEVSIRFLPSFSSVELTNMLKNFIQIDGKKDMQLHLSAIIHKKIARCILKETKSVDGIVKRLQGWKFSVTSLHGYKSAETTIGGVSFEKIDLESLESTIHSGLYFTGEVLDVDADLGGYNFQWAWSSGYVAALSATSS